MPRETPRFSPFNPPATNAQSGGPGDLPSTPSSRSRYGALPAQNNMANADQTTPTRRRQEINITYSVTTTTPEGPRVEALTHSIATIEDYIATLAAVMAGPSVDNVGVPHPSTVHHGGLRTSASSNSTPRRSAAALGSPVVSPIPITTPHRPAEDPDCPFGSPSAHATPSTARTGASSGQTSRARGDDPVPPAQSYARGSPTTAQPATDTRHYPVSHTQAASTTASRGHSSNVPSTTNASHFTTASVPTGITSSTVRGPSGSIQPGVGFATSSTAARSSSSSSAPRQSSRADQPAAGSSSFAPSSSVVAQAVPNSAVSAASGSATPNHHSSSASTPRNSSSATAARGTNSGNAARGDGTTTASGSAVSRSYNASRSANAAASSSRVNAAASSSRTNTSSSGTVQYIPRLLAMQQIVIKDYIPPHPDTIEPMPLGPKGLLYILFGGAGGGIYRFWSEISSRGAPWRVVEGRKSFLDASRVYRCAYKKRLILIEPPSGSPHENSPHVYRVVPYGLDSAPMDLSVPDPDDLDIPEGAEKYYVVIVGEEPGVWTEWYEAGVRTQRVLKRAKFQSVDTRAEAISLYLRAWLEKRVKAIPVAYGRFDKRLVLPPFPRAK
ncbi:hypothetical protein CVT26_002991 [Gymnopilus dilepis]|uniref:Ribonuclease H1 N-terminal domain-containing protein n=1 Tax=Gymnopilus dilepis TaxID=231916 RepID=A0A409Y4I6_9AGAR|nr:hypothetical protein CVT26_002991 [Gymnopilus dilepis]